MKTMMQHSVQTKLLDLPSLQHTCLSWTMRRQPHELSKLRLVTVVSIDPVSDIVGTSLGACHMLFSIVTVVST